MSEERPIVRTCGVRSQERFRLKSTPAELSAWADTPAMTLTALDTYIEDRYWALRASETTGENVLTLMKMADPDLQVHTKRCILPVTGSVGQRMASTGEKQTLVFSLSSEMIFGLAAVFQNASDGSRAQLTVLQTAPNSLLTRFFPSQLVVVHQCDIRRWLNPHMSWIQVQDVIRPLSAVELKGWMALPANAP